MSETSKRYRTWALVTEVISWILLLFPLAFYIGVAYYKGEPSQKFVLGATITVSMFLVVLNFIFKMKLRCFVWILLVGIQFVIKNIETMLWILMITSMLDEFIVMPIHKMCKARFTINREIDRRI